MSEKQNTNGYFINLTTEYPQSLLPKPATIAAWFFEQSPVTAYIDSTKATRSFQDTVQKQWWFWETKEI